MNTQLLIETVKRLVENDKGLLAMDESTSTCNKRFAKLSIPQTEEARREYREWILTTPGLSDSISGVILYDETIRQKTKDGTPFLKVIADSAMVAGIKVDTGAKNMAGFDGEKVTEGLDGLRGRLAEYFQMGARFAKWRAVIRIGEGIPSRECVDANADALARYAALCQEAGLVPIVEPEVLMEGSHTLEICSQVTERVLRTVFNGLYSQRVMPEGMILKPNMVLPGIRCPTQVSDNDVADATVKCLLRAVPGAVPVIAFLSGGQLSELASQRLNAMNVSFRSQLPWKLSFSFGRALQEPALDLWNGKEFNVHVAQQALSHRAQCNRAARGGNYNAAMENPPKIFLNDSLTLRNKVPSRRKFIVGNWKMFTNTATAASLTEGILNSLGDVGNVDLALCPPFPYLALVRGILKGTSVALGAQNLYPELEGAFTGEVSGLMLKDLGCKYVILGHTERRHLFFETDLFINQKVRFALAHGLKVILCVGENVNEREDGQTEAVLARQLRGGLRQIQVENLPNLSIAYEPVWAIGIHGHEASPEQVKEAHATIRRHFAKLFDESASRSLIIQYGGSVKPENAVSLLSQDGVDGALIGGASLNAAEFIAIIHSANEQPQAEGKSA